MARIVRKVAPAQGSSLTRRATKPDKTAVRLRRAATPTRVYFDHTLDSTRWNGVPIQPDDIILATSSKSGTTWVQRIISVLLVGRKLPDTLMNVSPWVDARFVPAPVKKLVADAERLTFRRFMKSHVPFDALPYSPEARYITVGRDGRDVALSLYNHYSGYTDKVIELLNSPKGTFENRFEKAPDDIHLFLKTWLTKGNPAFPWESDGFPFSSHFRCVQSFWDYRRLPNLLHVHYADLKRDLGGEAARIASFIGIEPTPDVIRNVTETCLFNAMRAEGTTVTPEFEGGFHGGNARFFHSGTVGKWRDVFTKEELALYRRAVQRNLTPDCARWLERGRLAGPSDLND